MLGTSKSIWGFDPRSIPGCTLWLDGADNASMNSTSAVTVWNDKSGQSNTMAGTGTWSGGTMVFNGTTNAFSNTAYAFPFGAYSMFAVYSNTTAPVLGAYMNAVYGSNGFPMMGTFGPSRFVSARSVVANGGAVTRIEPAVGWAARIASTGTDQGLAVTTDPSGNVIVTGSYDAALTLNNGNATTGATLLRTSADCFIAKYTSAGSVAWATRADAAARSCQGRGIATNASGNVLVTGTYNGALNLRNTGESIGATLSYTGAASGLHCFVVNYSPAGSVVWVTRIAITTNSSIQQVIPNALAVDSSGNVFVTGRYTDAISLFNATTGLVGATLPPAVFNNNCCFVVKYTSAGNVEWATRIESPTSATGFGVATDTSGNVFVTGSYFSSLILYNTGGTSGATLATGNGDCFLAKYSSAGAVLWAARIAGSGTDQGFAVATDPSDNVIVTGQYTTNTLTLSNTNGTTGATLPFAGTVDCFIGKYSSAGAVLWATRIFGTLGESGQGLTTDSDGNVFVTGTLSGTSATAVMSNANGTTGPSLSVSGTSTDCFLGKYSSAGSALWGTMITSTNTTEQGLAVDTDTLGNVFVVGFYGGTVSLRNSDSTTGASLLFVGVQDVFLAKYNPDGYIANAPTPASSNVLVSATYTPSTFSPFVNGFTQTTLAGTTLDTTGLFLGGPSNYFSGSISEVLVFGTTLTAAQRQSVEGYLSRKWGIGTRLISTHPFYTIPPFNRYFNPTDVPGCSLWLDGIDGNSLTTAPMYAADSGFVTTLAGSGTAAFADGTGASASFSSPTGVAVIPSSDVAVVADTQNQRIRLVTPLGVVTTLAGSGTATFADGTGAGASFNGPWAAAVIPSTGDIAVADRDNHRIRLVTYPGGVVTTLAGSSTAALTDGTGAAASFRFPSGVAFIPSLSSLVVADTNNNCIRLVTYPGGVVTTLAGSSTAAFADGTGAAARFNGPIGVAVIPSTGVIAVSDSNNHRIRLVTQAGVVTTLAGNATGAFVDGTGTAASFNLPRGVAVTSTGQIVVADYGNQRIRVVTTSTYAADSGVVTTLAGSTFGIVNGTGASARFFLPGGVAVTSTGQIVVADMNNHRIRLITSSATWSDKSGLNNNVTGLATWTGSNVSFNGSTQAFSNTSYVFPISNYSMFAVYSNTTAPAAAAYMNAVYGSNGFPMLGTFDVAKNVSARSVVANTGALSVPVGWAARIAGAGNDRGQGIATDSVGAVFVIGYCSAAVTIFNQGPSGSGVVTLPFIGGNDVFVAKYSSAGAVLWAARIAGTTTSGDIGYGIATDASGNVLVTGEYGAAVTIFNQGPSGSGVVTLPYSGTGSDCFIAKYSSDGAVLWAARIAGTSGDAGRGIATDLSGNVFVTGYYGAALTIFNQGPSGTAGTTLPFTGGYDVFVAKYSPDGAVLWAARIASAGTVLDLGYGIATDSSGNVLVTGEYRAALTVYNQGPSGTAGTTLPFAGGANDCFIAKYSSAGAVLWAAQIAGTGQDQGNAIATDPSGNVVVTGQYSAALTLYNTGGGTGATLPFTAGIDCFVAKYSPDGAVLWAARIASAGNDIGYGIATDTSGNVLVTGNYSSAGTIVYNQGPSGSGVVTLPFTGGQDCFIAKYSSAGAVLWAARVAGTTTGNDVGYGIATDASGNVLVTGTYQTALTVFNQGGTTATTLPFAGGLDCFIAKYTPDGFITAPVPASSNVLVSATYTPSTFSPFVNGTATPTTLAGTTVATTGIFVGGPSNYFNGTISELLVYSANLSAAQRQRVEGYLIQKWGLSAQTVAGHQYKLIPPAASQPAQFDEVTQGNWTRDWQPELQSLVAANASATPTYSALTGTLAGYKIGFLAPNGNIYLPPHAVNQGCALITPTPTGATFSTTAITGVSTGQIYGNDWIGGAMYPDGMLYLIPFDASYNNTPGIADLNTNTNVFRSNPYTAGNTTNFNLQFRSGTMAPDGNMFILPYAVATGGAVSLRFFNPITKLMVAYSVNKPTAERFSFAILAPNGNIYGVAITGPAQACMINPTARTFTTIGSNATVQYRGLVYGGNGSIYMIPNASATGIGILNTTTNTITANAIPGGLGYYGGVLGPDGNIYCIPSTATNIGVINTRTNTFSTLGSVAANSYGSAVLAPNGNIYLIPFGASGIGMISFTGLNMLPSTSFCLSPYVNRGFFTE